MLIIYCLDLLLIFNVKVLLGVLSWEVDLIWVLTYERYLTPIRIPLFVTPSEFELHVRTLHFSLIISCMPTAMPVSLRIQEPEGIDWST